MEGGLQLSVQLAIDFTISNGSPSSPMSLHNIAPNTLNGYQKVALNSLSKFLILIGYGLSFKRAP